MAEYISPDAEEVIPAWVALVGHLAPFSSILMFLSPIPTIRQVLRSGTVGDLPLLPYTSMVASCFVWIVYGIIKREPMIWGTNLVEFVLSVYYFVEFTNYAPKHSPTFPGSVDRHIQFCIAIWVVCVWIAIFASHDNATSTIGDLTVALTVLTFASPLAAVKAVLESQSSEAIPWPFTLAALFNCCIWAIVGIFEMHDIYVYFPAVLGLIFAAMQVALKLHFGDHMNSDDSPNYTRAPVEMPYPVLGSVRQVVLLGSHMGTNSNNNQYYNNLPNDLEFDSNMPNSNTDYVEMALPLTSVNPIEQQQQSLQQLQQLQQQQLQQPSPNAMGFANPPPPPHPMHKHRDSSGGMEYSTVEGLESVVFGDNDTAPPPNSLRDSFRSRSGTNIGAGHGPGQGRSHGY